MNIRPDTKKLLKEGKIWKSSNGLFYRNCNKCGHLLSFKFLSVASLTARISKACRKCRKKYSTPEDLYAAKLKRASEFYYANWEHCNEMNRNWQKKNKKRYLENRAKWYPQYRERLAELKKEK